MIHGKKDAEVTDGITSARPVVAIVFLAIAGAWAFGLVRNFDRATQLTTLPLIGTTLQLGEADNEGGNKIGGERGGLGGTKKDDDD